MSSELRYILRQLQEGKGVELTFVPFPPSSDGRRS